MKKSLMFLYILWLLWLPDVTSLNYDNYQRLGGYYPQVRAQDINNTDFIFGGIFPLHNLNKEM